MNWDIFSQIGYASIAVWLCMPLLWLVHIIIGHRGWLPHIALLLAVVAFVLAKMNSRDHVSRIQVDRSTEIQEQLDRQLMARQAATQAREDEVAQIRFAEDSKDDFLDEAGMDAADRKYMESIKKGDVPEWKKEKKQRSVGSDDDSLEALIGAVDEQEGVDAEAAVEEEPVEPILMSDSDKHMANRLNSANFTMIRVMFGLGVFFVVYDYLKRANMYRAAYFPLPLPSGWPDSLTPREPVTVRPVRPRRSLVAELRFIARRGESFVYMTNNTEAAAGVPKRVQRLPLRRSPVDVLDVGDDELMDDDFVFDTLWFGRNSFVVNSAERCEQMLARFIELMETRRSTRAHTRQTVHVMWDVDALIPDDVVERFAILGRATGFTLLICRHEHQANPDRVIVHPNQRTL